MQPTSLRTAPVQSRRRFLEASALSALGLPIPSTWLTQCGDDGGGLASVAPLTVAPNTPWWLQNNFAPVFDETEAFDLPVRGALPPELVPYGFHAVWIPS